MDEETYVTPCWYCHYDSPRLECECAMCDCEDPEEDEEGDDF